MMTMGAEKEKRVGRGQEAMELVTEAAGLLFEHWGDRAIVGRVWAVLLLTGEPLDASSLRRALSVSSGALSMALKDLAELGLVYRESKEGTRRLYYRAETDLWLIATRIFRERERKRLGAVLDLVKKAERLLEDVEPEEQLSETDAYRLEQVRRLANLGDFVLGLLDAVMERTKVELKAAQKWLSVSGKLGGEPLSRVRRAINASRRERRKR